MPQGYLSTDPNAGEPVAPGGYLSTDPNAGTAAEPNSVGTFLSHAWSQLDPRSLATAIKHPIATVQQMGAAHQATFNKAKESYQKGDYLTAARHFVDYLVPIVGPAMDQASDAAQRGELAASAGDVVGLGLGMFGPEAVKQIAATRATNARMAAPQAAPATTPRADLRTFAAQQDIPLDAATASGNRFVRGAQRIADESALGSVVAERANTRQTAAVGTAAERLASQSHPIPVTAEQAGTAAQRGVSDAVARFTQQAERAYAKAEQGAMQARNRIGAKPVDLATVKAELAPLYQTLRREAELVPLQGGKARALTALDRLMNGPDQVSIGVADAATGELGVLAGAADVARTPGQGAAAQAFAKLRSAVDKAAVQAGPDVINALRQGRQATKAKWAAVDALDALTGGGGMHGGHSASGEPVRSFRQVTARGDSAVHQLEELNRLAPDAVPQVGRAWLDQTMEKLHTAGLNPLDRAQGALRDWETLGAHTKSLLFKDAGYIKDLDSFFKLSAELAKNPNPSGTALTMVKGGEMTGWVTNPVFGVPISLGAGTLSTLLHSSAGAKLLSEGLRLPGQRTAATVAWLERLNALTRNVNGATSSAGAQ